MKDFPGKVYSYSEPGGHVGRKEITEDFCQKDCDRSFGPNPKGNLVPYWKDDSHVGDFVYWVEKVDGQVCNENGFGKFVLMETAYAQRQQPLIIIKTQSTVFIQISAPILGRLK